VARKFVIGVEQLSIFYDTLNQPKEPFNSALRLRTELSRILPETKLRKQHISETTPRSPKDDVNEEPVTASAITFAIARTKMHPIHLVRALFRGRYSSLQRFHRVKELMELPFISTDCQLVMSGDS
jgi:hypothetical protein